ncbi:unnamed protein product [Lampetra planeri]
MLRLATRTRSFHRVLGAVNRTSRDPCGGAGLWEGAGLWGPRAFRVTRRPLLARLHSGMGSGMRIFVETAGNPMSHEALLRRCPGDPIGIG